MKPKIVGHLAAAFVALSMVSCGHLPWAHTPTSTAAASPTVTPLSPAIPTQYNARGELTRLIKEIHDQYEIEGCYVTNRSEIDVPYEEALAQMIVILASDPLIHSLAPGEQSAIFREVTGFGAGFHTDSEDATLVVLPTNRDCMLGSHHAAPDQIYVVGADGTLWKIGVPGLVLGLWWIDDRWVLLNRVKLDSSSGPTAWSIWHIGQVGEDWELVVDFTFDPIPYNFYELPVHFEDGYLTMIAEVEYWYAEHPCEFNSDFTDAYKHGDWKVKNTYHLTGDQYELIDTQILDFPVTSLETNEPVSIDWQAYCISPLIFDSVSTD